MSARLAISLLVVSAMLFSGCGGGDEGADGTAVAPPPPPAATPSVDGDATSHASATPATGTTDSNSSSTEIDQNTGGATTTVVETKNMVLPDGPLAAHAKALSIVRPDHYAIVKFDLAGARQAKLLKDLPADPDEMVQQLNVGHEAQNAAEMLVDVDVLWVSIGPPSLDAAPGDPPMTFGAYAQFKTAEAAKAMVEKWQEDAEPVEYQGVTFFRPTRAGASPMYYVDGNNMFITLDEQVIRQVIDAGGKILETPLLAKLKDAPLDAHVMVAGSFGPMKDTASAALTEMITDSPLKIDPKAGQLPSQLEWGTVAIHLDGDPMIDIDADMDSPDSAETMNTTVSALIGAGKLMLLLQQQQAAEDPVAGQVMGLANSLLNAVSINKNEQHVDVSLARVPEIDKLNEILAGAQAADEKVDSLNKARMLAIAALNYQSAHGKFPSNLKNEAGEEVLSWRVALLPYLEQQQLYDKFGLQQSWESAANSHWQRAVVSTYQTPASDGPIGTTWYMLSDMPAGMLFVEGGVRSQTYWVRPDTLVLDPANLSASLGHEPEDGYVVAFTDGRVMRMTAEQIKQSLAGEGAAEPPVTTPDLEPGVELAPEPTPDPTPDPVPQARALRTWSDATGKFKVEAVFVKRIGDKVTIKRTDNDMEVTIPVAALSEADQAYLKSLKK